MAKGVSIDLIVDPKKAIAGIGQVEGKASGAADTLGKLGKVAAGALLGLAAAGAAAAATVGAFVGKSIEAAGEAQKVAAQTDAVIASTGAAAGRTAKQVDELATRLSRMSGIDDETVKAGENLLLTFTQIKGTTFDEATQSALDMSVAMGTDLQSAVLQLGKALNDPIAGATKLQRVGVHFTQTQKDQIANYVKLGQTAKAQQVILDEVNKEFGGSALAFGNTWEGAVDKIKTAFQNIQEEVGGAFLPAFTAAATVVSDLFDAVTDNPKLEAWLDGIGSKVTSALTPITGLLGDVANSDDPFKTLEDGLTKISPLFATVAPILDGLKGALPGITKAFGDLGKALGAGLAEYGPQIGKALAQVVVAIVPLIPQILKLIPPLLQLALQILPPLASLLATVLPPAIQAVSAVLSVLGPVLAQIVSGMQGGFQAIGLLFDLLSGNTSLQGFVQQAQAIPGPVGAIIGAITGATSAVQGFVRQIIDAVRNAGVFVTEIPAKIGAAFSEAGKWLVDAGKSIIQGLIDGINAMIKNAQNAVKGVMDAVSRFFPHSPAKEGPFSGKGWTLYSGQAIGEGLAAGMRASTPGVRSSALSLSNQVTDALGSPIDVQARASLAGRYDSSSMTSTAGGVNVVMHNQFNDQDPRLAGRQLGRELVRTMAGAAA